MNSDSHEPGNLLTDGWAKTVAIGAGLNEADAEKILLQNPLQLLDRIAQRRLKKNFSNTNP